MVPGKRGTTPRKESPGEKHRGTASAHSAKPARLAKGPLEPKQILITDDEQYLRELLASQLQEKGYKCVSLASKADAYRWSLEHKPDLIITDINSPGMDGFQFLRLIKSHSLTGKEAAGRGGFCDETVLACRGADGGGARADRPSARPAAVSSCLTRR
ncbi:MAG: diguanylate cyclase [Bacteroidetes bacterium]|nr:diguanylate cyclase [Bacteroidota bacterium]